MHGQYFRSTSINYYYNDIDVNVQAADNNIDKPNEQNAIRKFKYVLTTYDINAVISMQQFMEHFGKSTDGKNKPDVHDIGIFVLFGNLIDINF